MADMPGLGLCGVSYKLIRTAVCNRLVVDPSSICLLRQDNPQSTCVMHLRNPQHQRLGWPLRHALCAAVHPFLGDLRSRSPASYLAVRLQDKALRSPSTYHF